MERSKRELARSIGSVINHCVAVTNASLPLHTHREPHTHTQRHRATPR